MFVLEGRGREEKNQSIYQQVEILSLSLFLHPGFSTRNCPLLERQIHSPADMVITEHPRIGDLSVERACCFCASREGVFAAAATATTATDALD